MMIGVPVRGARSQSDADLAERVSHAVGFEVTGWEIERWRQAGLVQPAEHEYPGKGSHAQYGDEAARQATVVAALVRKHRNLTKVARILFVRGLYVREDAIRAALKRGLAEVDKWIGPLNTDSERDRAYEKAERLAYTYARRTKLGKRIRRRLKGRGVAPSELVPPIYFNLMHIIKTGEPAPGHDLRDILETTGLIGLSREELGGLGPIATDGTDGPRNWFRQARLGNVLTLLESSSLNELQDARDFLVQIIGVLKDFATVLLQRFPGSDALGLAMLEDTDLDETLLSTGVPFGLALLPYVRTPNGQELMAAVRAQQETLRSMAEFVKSLSPAAAVVMRTGDPEAFARLPLDEQVRLREAAMPFLNNATAT